MVVSSAIVDHGMTAGKYFMCDAAVASEAYDSTMAMNVNMVNIWWEDYSNRTWAANWYKLFAGTGDTRKNLTWRDRFKRVVAATEVWNFYSTGDEIFSLTVNPGFLSGSVRGGLRWGIIPISVNVNFGRHSWQKQELFKGIRYSDSWTSFGGTAEAGWGFEEMWINTRVVGDRDRYTMIPIYTNAARANVVPDVGLRTRPVFKHSPDWLVGTNVLTQTHLDFMLGMGIPALTPSTGITLLSEDFVLLEKQFNLNSDSGSGFKPNGWPDRRRPDFKNWLHNDIKDVAYFFNYLFFDKIVTEGGLR